MKTSVVPREREMFGIDIMIDRLEKRQSRTPEKWLSGVIGIAALHRLRVRR